MKLYYYDRSPYCIAIERVIRAAGAELELVPVSSFDRTNVIRLTGGAYYLVPVIHDGEEIVYERSPESQCVATYVDQKYLGGRLFPVDKRGLQTILLGYLENTVEDVTFKVCDAMFLPTVTDVVERTMVIRYKERKFGEGCVDRWRRDLATLIEESGKLLRPFEEMLASNEYRFLLGATPVYADFLLYGILGNYTYCGLNSLPADMPYLTAWNENIRSYSF